MSNQHPRSSLFQLKLAALSIAVAGIALAPWWRNHDYLRDFYDYGLFINVNARLAQGQHPYVDFTTPAQSAAFLLNYAAEKIGGNTYIGMTTGAAALILLGSIGLTWLLARRFSLWAAALLALAITAGSASQHTIAFYNPVGVFAMALTVWGFAMAPLLSRKTWAWHVLAGIGLIVGGLNKINFHLLACLMATGWIIQAWVTQRANTRHVLSTAAFLLLCGFALPIGIEIAWTGASWNQWYYNIVELPLSARGARISYLFSPQLYLQTLHGYYGELRVPQIGLIAVLMPAIAIIAAWRHAKGDGALLRRVLLILAGLLAALAGAALLLTNNEIAYITFAAALVITIGLWLGFNTTPRGIWFNVGVILPALILAAAGWESAWRGQRSQFGHDDHPRAQYLLGKQAGDTFRYIGNLHLPPGLVESLTDLEAWRNRLPPKQWPRIYYGPAAEWLEHVWPVNKVRGLPLVAAAFDGARENTLLEDNVIGGDTFDYLLVYEAWDHWNQAVQDQLTQTAAKQYLGTVFTLYTKLAPGTLSARPLDFLGNGLGTNVDSSRLVSLLPVQTLQDTRNFLGTEDGDGRIDVNTPCHRISAEYVLARNEGDSSEPLTVKLAVYARIEDSLLPRWEQDVTLPQGIDELIVPIGQIDGSGLPVTFTVTVPPTTAGRIRAGWRGFQLWDMPDHEDQPPVLRATKPALRLATTVERNAILPESMQDLPVFFRGARPEGEALVLDGGTEVWIHAHGLFPDIRITTKLADPTSDFPNLRLVYYKGGRIEQFSPLAKPENGTARYKVWTPENGGWIGILAPPEVNSTPITITINSATKP